MYEYKIKFVIIRTINFMNICRGYLIINKKCSMGETAVWVFSTNSEDLVRGTITALTELIA